MVRKTEVNKEIGSHFALEVTDEKVSSDALLPWEISDRDCTYTLTGRSAISLAIKDISVKREIKKAYLPTYCCSSMLEPFIKNDIVIDFYEVKYQEDQGIYYDIDIDKDCDVFFGMSYFGINSEIIDEYITIFSKRDIPVIEDITHRLLSESHSSRHSDYTVASLRKWFPIPAGGYLRKERGTLRYKPKTNSDELIKLKREAMREKKEYLDGNQAIDKGAFLKKYQIAEKALFDLDDSYKIDSTSFDNINSLNLREIKDARRKNAMVLYEGLKKLKEVKPLILDFDIVKDCPLFVPVIIENGKRDNLRDFLIKNRIYCPVHWPIKKGMQSGIEEVELSLICDQRYTVQDMACIIRTLTEWENAS